MLDGIRFPEEFRFRAPSGFLDALDEVANQTGSTRSDFVRRATLAALRQEGVKVTPRYDIEGPE
jgi:hypothetical protein